MAILGLCAAGLLLGANGMAADCGPGYGYGGFYGVFPPGVYVRDYVPYYAMHPPVYYSYPVPRPYGYSPYAYPPGVMTPEPAPVAPLMIENKFVPTRRELPVKKNHVASAPLRISNPYVEPGELPGRLAAGPLAADPR